MCACLLDYEAPIYAIESGREFFQGSLVAQILERQRVKELVMDSRFLPMSNKVLEILKPIDTLIVKYQSYSVPISKVLPDFYAFTFHFKVLYTNKVITLAEREYLCALSEDRNLFMYGEAHGFLYLLDHRFTGEGLPRVNCCQLEDLLLNSPSEENTPVDDERQMHMLSELNQFFILCRRQK